MGDAAKSDDRQTEGQSHHPTHQEADQRKPEEHLNSFAVILRGLNEVVVQASEELANTRIFSMLASVLGMLAASVGAFAVAASGGIEAAAVVIGTLGVLGTSAPLIEQFIERRQRKRYRYLSDIQDPVLRRQVEVAYEDQRAWESARGRWVSRERLVTTKQPTMDLP